MELSGAASNYSGVTTVNAGSYKEVTVTVSWQQGVQGQQGNNPHNVSIVTCIAP